MDEHAKRFRRLPGWLAKAVRRVGILYRLHFGFINVPFALLLFGCAFFGAACAHDDDSSADHSQHHHHHGGSYGQGQGGGGGGWDRSGASQSSTPIPGM
jgi:hypothetical protein